jgi:hypothetical protein
MRVCEVSFLKIILTALFLVIATVPAKATYVGNDPINNVDPSGRCTSPAGKVTCTIKAAGLNSKQRVQLNKRLIQIGQGVYKNASPEFQKAWQNNKSLTVPDASLEDKTTSDGAPLKGQNNLLKYSSDVVESQIGISEAALDGPVAEGSSDIFGDDFAETLLHETGHGQPSIIRQEDIVGVGTAPIENKLEDQARRLNEEIKQDENQ